MNKILELREKRAKLWEDTKAFLDSRRNENDLLSAEDTATYEKMEAEGYGYLLGLFVIVMLVSLAVGVFSCLTCCMGAMLLAIPFVGTIVLLPTFVFRWQFMLEFFDNGEMLNR